MAHFCFKYSIALSLISQLKFMKNYKKYFSIAAPPEDVYLALTVQTTMLLWTGEDVVMSTVPGSEFSLWDGSIEGKNLEFVEGKKIVQEWYFGDQEEPSIVTIILHPDKKDSTSVELRHSNIPDEAYDEIVEGWNGPYFGALQEFYEGE